MRNRILAGTLCAAVAAGVISLGGGSALAQEGPMTPELAAKREMVRKQEEQRVTAAQRKAAAEALKAERLRLQQAKEAAGLAPAGGAAK